MSQLPVQLAWRLADCPEHQRWLVDGLWSEEAVGIIGGEPKCCKSFLALDLAVAVAAGVPCLRRFAVSRPGRVLLYPAEDALHIVRRRLEGICAAVGTALAELDVQVITAPSLRLDLEADRARLEETVATLKPRFLILDPFVRLHRIDENVSGDVRHRCSPSCANCNDAMPSPSPSSITPGRAPEPSVPARPCVARPNSTPGAIPTSTSVATPTIASRSPSSIAPPRPSPASRSRSPSAITPLPCSPRTPITKSSRVPRPLQSISASPPPWRKASNREPSPNCAHPAVSAPKHSISASPR